jgi:hypothetical protein
LPGAAGVGPIRAAQLVRRYGSLSGVLDAGFFQTQAEMLRLYRRIATMDSSAPLPSLADQTPTWAPASSLARSWGLNQLANRLDGMAWPCGRECRERNGQRSFLGQAGRPGVGLSPWAPYEASCLGLVRYVRTIPALR